MSNNIYFLTEDGVEAMEYIIDDGNEFNLEDLTNLSKYKESNLTPIELDPEDKNLKNNILVINERVEKAKAAKLRAKSSYAAYTVDQKTLFLIRFIYENGKGEFVDESIKEHFETDIDIEAHPHRLQY
ncbi:uncharacterized protein BX663DRAFT_546382 [Cokeromyces recurvatus]|uniref:uncharacterized protein n=1 Tax=Cokeromyces recurvatus TaxID=90255 RepID=UPI00221FD867|nr:uncharacterized protein BX663DRAFT_546382 [Cokeromyces recurvatus]KAI7898444.1 hypothetical protein BX663DRAFT_546382 [Cokeromyces recurvatus]